MYIPVLVTLCRGTKFFVIVDEIDIFSSEEPDWDPNYDTYFTYDERLPPIISSIIIEDIRNDQERDTLFLQERSTISKLESSSYIEDDLGVMVRVTNIDDTVQIFLPVSLLQNLLLLSCYNLVYGHPSVRDSILVY